MEDEDEEEEENSDEGVYDDPDLADLDADTAAANDSEIDSDDALAESDADRFAEFAFRGSSKPAIGKGQGSKRATAADFMSDEEAELNGESDDESDLGGAGLDEDDSGEDDDMDDGLDGLVDGLDDLLDGAEDEEGEDDEDEDDSEDDGSGSESEDSAPPKSKARSTAPSLGSLSNSADVVKGTAIQKQRRIYDGLLNLRIRLQKALIAANTLPTLEEEFTADSSEPYEAAEEAAVKLLDTISSMKSSFGPLAKTGEKRKRAITMSSSTQEIWDQLKEDDQRMMKFRDDHLEKWSHKVQAVNASSANALAPSLTTALQAQLADGERLIKRTRVPRSCAPAQAAQKMTEDETIYDDADFYQTLLKELVAQRTVETATATTGALPSVMLTAARDAKTHRNVDRKASKGRKMNFAVHAKLQNFMAPEDRRGWEQGAIDRFFGALFGKRMEVEEESGDSDEDMLRAEEEGLKLFRG